LDVGRSLPLETRNLALIEFIRAEVRTHGPVSFAWFMEQALYHPEHGYYSSGRAEIGRRGDYFTNVSVGPLFGRLLAAQFAEIWERLGKIDNFVIVEQGAHHGEFARDVLEAVRERSPEFFEALRYQVVEPFPVLQDRQSETVAEFGDKVRWQKSLDHVEPFSGIHVSNELLDSMPVHLICSRGPVARVTARVSYSHWQEKYVALDGDQFAFVDQPVVDPKLQVRVEGLPVRPSGYETEINLAALDWIHNLAAKISRGYVLAIDYGFPRDEFYAPHRSAGTLQVRSQHQNLNSPFEQIGHADITAHVDWTSVAEHAESLGLHVRGFTDQHHFITGIISDSQEFSEVAAAKTKRALQTLLHPEMLGRAFQVLALGKDVDLGAPLAGFKFARDPRATLGI
jgi:SAM-dependent MidA family methyltransferase